MASSYEEKLTVQELRCCLVLKVVGCSVRVGENRIERVVNRGCG